MKKTFWAILSTVLCIFIACSCSDDTQCRHEFGEWEVSDAPVCSENYFRCRVCTLCGNIETEPSPAAHREEIIPARPATCTEAGATEGAFCTVCGIHTLEQEALPPIGHALTVTEELSSTCISEGMSAGAVCSNCGYVEKEAQVIEIANTHSFVDGICTLCGSREGADHDLAFELANGAYTVVGIGSCTDTDIVIPAVHLGIPVSAIGAEAFKGCDTIKSVVIPASVKNIGLCAFYLCNSLENAVIGDADEPEKLTVIGESAFSSTPLTSVYIGNGVSEIGITAFKSTQISSLTLGKTVLLSIVCIWKRSYFRPRSR